MLGEIFDTLGAYGRLEIRQGRSRELEREYVEGMYWDGGVFSREMIRNLETGKARFENAAILISDLEIKSAQEMASFLDLLIRSGHKSLFLVAGHISDQALSIILSGANREKIEVIAVRAPAMDIVTRQQALEDLALLTGGRPHFHYAGETLASVRVADLGYARRAWADMLSFGIVGGKGDPRALRQHIASLRARLQSQEINSGGDYQALQTRLGRLMGGTAFLWVGATTTLGIETRSALAERTASAMRGAIREGVLPGGGIAFLACQASLQQRLKLAVNPDEQAACRILSEALEMPFRVLLENAGHEPEKILYQIALAGPGYGFDLNQAQLVRMDQSGIYDAASVVKAAMFNAVHGAALALTIDVLVHLRNPPDGHTTT
jgi:chaperonin GroEL